MRVVNEVLTVRTGSFGPFQCVWRCSFQRGFTYSSHGKKGETFVLHVLWVSWVMESEGGSPSRLVMERPLMKSRDTLIRLKRFQLEEKRRRVRQIEMMLAEFARMTAELDREIGTEEKRAGITDPRHFAYPTYARAASVRRDNLKSSIAELSVQIEDARAAQEEAQAELLKVEAIDIRDKTGERGVEGLARA